MLKKIFFVLFFVLSITFCSNSEDNSSDLIGIRVNIPNSIEKYNNSAKNFKHIQGLPTIINIAGAKCSSCIHELKHWNKLIEKNLYKYTVNYYFIAEGSPNFYFKENVLNKNFLERTPIFLDVDSLFIKINGLEEIRNNKTLILDPDGNLIFFGSPYSNPDNLNEIVSFLEKDDLF